MLNMSCICQIIYLPMSVILKTKILFIPLQYYWFLKNFLSKNAYLKKTVDT